MYMTYLVEESYLMGSINNIRSILISKSYLLSNNSSSFSSLGLVGTLWRFWSHWIFSRGIRWISRRGFFFGFIFNRWLWWRLFLCWWGFFSTIEKWDTYSFLACIFKKISCKIVALNKKMKYLSLLFYIILVFTYSKRRDLAIISRLLAWLLRF